MRELARERTANELREILQILDTVKCDPGRLNHPALNSEMMSAGIVAVTCQIYERKLGDVHIEHVIEEDGPDGCGPTPLAPRVRHLRRL